MVTGQPSTGKTTLVKRLCALVQEIDPQMPVSGFVTEEVKTGGTRAGFDVVSVPIPTVQGRLARKGLASKHKTGLYGVDVADFERVALPLLEGTGRRLVVIDEIGRMEMHSGQFECMVKRLLADPDAHLLGSVAAPRYGHVVPLAEEVKARPDVVTLHLKVSTREAVCTEAESQLRRLLLHGRDRDASERTSKEQR